MMQTLVKWAAASQPYPSTISAIWMKPKATKEPLLLAFAFTCDSKPRDKASLTNARRTYCQSLFSLVELSSTELLEMNQTRNWAGKPAKFGTWAYVCGAEGKYTSLCIGTVTLKGVRDEAGKAAKKKTSIEDLWDSIVDINMPGYVSKALKSVQRIIDEGAPVPL
jgi:hypothetical protein